MKLLFAIKTLTTTGGAERVFCTLCGELAGRGHDVTVITFDRPGSPAFYPLDARIERLDLGIGDTGRPARISETLRRVFALRRAVKAADPQIAVGFMHSMFVPLGLALANTGIPVVGSEHIVPEHYRRRPLQYALLLAAAPLLARVTVLSRAILDSYPRPLRRRMLAMPNPVATPSGRASPGATKPRYVLLNVARLDQQKDHATLLHAFSKVAADHPDWTLRILGEGALRSELESLAHELGLSGRISLPGVTPDIDAEYRAADAFVLSSRYEAFGLATAEAMSYGLPVIGFADCPGTNELIEHNQTGLLAPAGPDRALSLARELERLLADPGLRRRLGDAGRTAIARQASTRTICDLWETLFRELAEVPNQGDDR